MSGPRPVFLSYARDDGSEYACRLSADLRAAGIPTWIDRDIPPGADWDDAIDRALDGCRAVVVVLTPGAVLSRQVKGEWNYALTRFTPIVPVLAAECVVPRTLCVFHRLDLRDPGAPGVEPLVERLRRLDHEHADELVRMQAAFESLQESSGDPQRFTAKLDEIRRRLATRTADDSEHAERLAAALSDERAAVRRAVEARREHQRASRVGCTAGLTCPHFSGREHERGELLALLREPTARLVSVIGRGGMGKSTLVATVLEDLGRDRWPGAGGERPVDGVICLSARTTGVSLDRLEAGFERLLDAEHAGILQAHWRNLDLDLDERLRRLLEQLEDGTWVVVLDDLEEILDAGGACADRDLQRFFECVTARSSGVRIIVTSRTPLALPHGVTRFDKRLTLSQGLDPEEGVAVLRALDADGLRGLRDADAGTLKALVETVHGVPRGLEVVAGVLASDPFLSPAELCGTFYRRGDVLHELIDEMYRRLDDDGRRVMEALAVLGRPSTAHAVAFALQDVQPRVDVPRVLARLAQANVVTAHREQRLASLHPIDQDLALRRMAPEALARLHGRAAEYWAGLATEPASWHCAEDVEPLVLAIRHRVAAGEHARALELLERIDTAYLLPWGCAPKVIELRTAVAAGVRPGPEAFRHACVLAEACVAIGRNEEALRWSDAAIREIDGAAPASPRPWLAGAHALWYLSRYPASLERYEQALERAVAAGDAAGEAAALCGLARVGRCVGRVEEGLGQAREAIAIARRIGDPTTEVLALRSLGDGLRVLGRPGEARPCFEQALALERERGHVAGVIAGLLDLSLLAFAWGDGVDGVRHSREALAMANAIDSDLHRGMALNSLGCSYMAAGDPAAALESLQGSLRVFREIGYRYGESFVLAFIGSVTLAGGDARQAAALLEQGLEIARRIDEPRSAAYCETNLARASLGAGDAVAALAWAGRAEADFARAGVPHARAAHALADAAAARQAGDAPAEARALGAAARELQAAGDFVFEARELARAARALAEAHGEAGLARELGELCDGLTTAARPGGGRGAGEGA